MGLMENREGNTVQQFEGTATLIRRIQGRAAFEMPLKLEPGMYTLYLGVRDDTTSRLGTKRIDLKVPGLHGGETADFQRFAYGFGVEADESKLTAQSIFLQKGERRAQTPDEPFLSPGQDMAITVFDVPLSSFEPGEYTLRVRVTDHVRNAVLTRGVGFEVR